MQLNSQDLETKPVVQLSKAWPGRSAIADALSTRARRLLANSPWVGLAAKVVFAASAMATLAVIGTTATIDGAATPTELLATDARLAPNALLSAAAVEMTSAAGPAPASSHAQPPASEASAEPDAPSCGDGTVGCETGGVTAEGKVILNSASAHELTRLPSVGPARAEAIIALRERVGRFRRIEDLLRIRGIGPRSLQKIRPHVVLDAP